MTYRITGAAIALAVVALAIVGCNNSRPADPPANMSVVAELRKSAEGAGAGPAAAAVSTGTGWGTIKGKFLFDGAAPAPPKLDINKDVEVCGKHNLVDESLVVGSTGGLANVAIFVRSKSRVHPEMQSAATNKVLYDNKGCRFEPHVLAIALTQTLVLKNSDPVGHNSNCSPVGDAAINPLIPSGGEFEHKFGKAQLEGVSVTCNIHPWMKGYIFPRDNPYFAVTKDDGTFEIKNVPAGEEVEFQIWHERAPKGLEFSPEWARGRKKLTIPADGVLDLGDLKVASSTLK